MTYKQILMFDKNFPNIHFDFNNCFVILLIKYLDIYNNMLKYIYYMN